MGLFDFFRQNKKEKTTSEIVQPINIEETENSPIVFETKLTANDFNATSNLIESIVSKMVNEDPFQNFYKGMVDDDFIIGTKRVYRYEEITTMNVDIDTRTKPILSIEGIQLGIVPEHIFSEMKKYESKHVLTTFVFVTGGPYKEFSNETNQIVSGETPYNLDVYIQYN